MTLLGSTENTILKKTKDKNGENDESSISSLQYCQ